MFSEGSGWFSDSSTFFLWLKRDSTTLVQYINNVLCLGGFIYFFGDERARWSLCSTVVRHSSGCTGLSHPSGSNLVCHHPGSTADFQDFGCTWSLHRFSSPRLPTRSGSTVVLIPTGSASVLWIPSTTRSFGSNLVLWSSIAPCFFTPPALPCSPPFPAPPWSTIWNCLKKTQHSHSLKGLISSILWTYLPVYTCLVEFLVALHSVLLMAFLNLLVILLDVYSWLSPLYFWKNKKLLGLFIMRLYLSHCCSLICIICDSPNLCLLSQWQ